MSELTCVYFLFPSDSGNPTVFLQCGSWLFPLIPGRSPVLKTEQRTFMIPDINLDSEEHHTTQQQLVQGRFPTVGLVFSPEVDEDHINRFERILKCYADYRHYTSPSYTPTNDQATAEPSEPADVEPEVASEGSLVPAGDGNISVKNEEVSFKTLPLTVIACNISISFTDKTSRFSMRPSVCLSIHCPSRLSVHQLVRLRILLLVPFPSSFCLVTL